MKLLYPLLILIFICIIANGFMKITVGADPKEEAAAFLSDVRGGGLAKSVKHFGGTPVVAVQRRLGFVPHLYIGQEPNLAFMTGHPFETGTPKMVRMQNDRKALLPWQKPEDTAVDVPITFNAKVYSPMFLPLPMAYGQSMTEDELKEWLKDPTRTHGKDSRCAFAPASNRARSHHRTSPCRLRLRLSFKTSRTK